MADTRCKLVALAALLLSSCCSSNAEGPGEITYVAQLENPETNFNIYMCLVQRAGACYPLQSSYKDLTADATQFAIVSDSNGNAIPMTCCTVYGDMCSNLVDAKDAANVADSGTCVDWVVSLLTQAGDDTEAICDGQTNYLARALAMEYMTSSKVNVMNAALTENLSANFPNYGAATAAKQLGIAPTIIDFTNAANSVIPAWPEASC